MTKKQLAEGLREDARKFREYVVDLEARAAALEAEVEAGVKIPVKKIRCPNLKCAKLNVLTGKAADAPIEDLVCGRCYTRLVEM